MQQFSDGLPSNASVTISFKRGRRAFFSYSKKEKKRGTQFLNIWASFQLLGFILIFGVGFLAILSGIVVILLSFIFYGPPKYEPIVSCYAVMDAWLQVYNAFLVLILIFGPAIWAALVVYFRYEKWKTVFPKLNFWIHKLLEKTKKITIKKVNGKIFQIPCFHNTYLHYIATGEFEKYLESIKIRELLFTDNKWNATFLFKKNPKKGFLRVEFL
jgi:hypothetical protein